MVVGSVGAVAVSRDNELRIAPLRKGVLQPFPPQPLRDSLPIAVAGEHPSSVFWISEGRLVRRKVHDDGRVEPLEVLASDAADGTRVSAARAEGPATSDVVLYIGRNVSRELERAPRLWVDRQRSRRLSDEAGGATSVAVVGLGGNRMALLTIDGRTAMSPVHALSLELDANGEPHLGQDRVVFVAGPAERHTMISGVRVGPGPVALLAVSSDTTKFGLLSLLIGYGEAEAPASWVEYPNGLDPAPVTGVTLCGEPHVLFVRPESEKPGARHLLELGRVGVDGKVAHVETLSSAAKIRAISAWAPIRSSDTAGWVVMSTSNGAVARPLTCPPSRK